MTEKMDDTQRPLPQKSAPKEPPNKKGVSKDWIIENLKALFIAILLVLVIRSSIIEAFKIPSGSMIPTLLVGDHIFVNKFAYGLKIPFSDFFTDTPAYLGGFSTPRRGDIIVFKYPKDPSFYYIKRVIGLPGDKIKIKDKLIYINDLSIERKPTNRPDVLTGLDGRQYEKNSIEVFEEYSRATRGSAEGHLILLDKNNTITENYGETTVPPESLFVMGDNRDFSNDSRFWGFVPFKNVRGKALFVWLSLWFDFSGQPHRFRPERIGTIIR